MLRMVSKVSRAWVVGSPASSALCGFCNLHLALSSPVAVFPKPVEFCHGTCATWCSVKYLEGLPCMFLKFLLPVASSSLVFLPAASKSYLYLLSSVRLSCSVVFHLPVPQTRKCPGQTWNSPLLLPFSRGS